MSGTDEYADRLNNSINYANNPVYKPSGETKCGRCENLIADNQDLLNQIVALELVLEYAGEHEIRAKRQRDRAIYKVHQLGESGWHPDQEGEYGERF